jgi:hypothetical protein
MSVYSGIYAGYMIYQIEFDNVRSSAVRTASGHIRTILREGFRDRRYGTDLHSDCSRGPVRTTTVGTRYTVSVPPYLVVDTDNYTASPSAESFMRTVGKILVFMRQWLWDRCRSQTYNPNVRRCPRLSASGGHSPKNSQGPPAGVLEVDQSLSSSPPPKYLRGLPITK